MKHQNAVKKPGNVPLFTFVVLCLSVFTLPAGAQHLQYAKGLKNSVALGGNVLSTGIRVDKMGNIYVAGSFSGTADFDPGQDSANLTSNTGSIDVFIAKYDPSGKYVYVKAMRSKGEDQAGGVALDDSGNVYITGNFQGTVDFDPGTATANLITDNIDNKDIYIAKYDGSGRYVYAKSMRHTVPNYAHSYAIAADGPGNVYITGDFTGIVDFDPGPGTALRSNSLRYASVFTAKYDPAGNYVYANTSGSLGPENRYGSAIAADGSGNVFVSGVFSFTINFDTGSEQLTSEGLEDIFMVKYGASGKFVYAKSMGGKGSDYCSAILVDQLGGVYLTGSFQGSADFDPGANTSLLTSFGGADVFMARYDSTGNYIDAKAMGGTGADGGAGIAIDGSGNVCLTGSFEGAADFDPGAGIASLTSAGDADIFVATYDPSGNYRYAKAMGGTSADFGNDVAIDSSGNTYLTGSFRGSADLDPGTGTAMLTIGGSLINAFITCLDHAGNYEWTGQMGRYDGSTALADQGRSIAVDASSNTYITGTFQGTVDFDPGAGTASLTGSGTRDVFIERYDAAGNFVYAKAIGGAGNDYGYGIAADASGNVYVTGYFTGTADFDPGAGTASLTGSGTFIARYDAAGNYVYAKALGSAYFEFYFGASANVEIAVDASGNIYLTGNFLGTADFDPGPDSAKLTSAGILDVFIARYDASGNYVYAKAIGGSAVDQVSGIAVNTSGDVIITGICYSTVDFDPGAGTAFLTGSGVFIARYDTSGYYVYAKGLRGNGICSTGSIAVNGSGNVYITGIFSGTIDFDPGDDTAYLTNTGIQMPGQPFVYQRNDLFIAGYDASGNYVYAKAVKITSILNAENRGNAGNAIVADASGNIYITGTFSDTVDFDPGAGTASLAGAGLRDVFIAQYDAAGSYVYAKAMGGASDDIGYGIAADTAGNVYVTGSFQGVADFDRVGTAAGSMISASNAEDIFIAKYGPSAALPVHLLSFYGLAIRNGEAVQLNWSTASETNNAWFDVERSKSGIQFETIGQRQGCFTCTGLQHYQYFDNDPYSGVSYYRLKQVDKDHSVSYSPVIAIRIAGRRNLVVHAYPNVTDGAYTLTVENDHPEKQVSIRVFNAAGGLIDEKRIRLVQGYNTFQYSLSGRARGAYYISIADRTGALGSSTMIIKK